MGITSSIYSTASLMNRSDVVATKRETAAPSSSRVASHEKANLHCGHASREVA